jgi:predicted helicase
VALARLARDIRMRLTTVMQYETEREQFTQLMKSFQTALIQDLKSDDFADMYAQTIAYGLLSTRIADPSKQSVDDLAAHLQTNPFLRELLQTFLQMGGRDTRLGIDFDELGINDVIELLNQAQMDEVLRDFNNRNAHEDPVIHFYELFLKEYDAKKRMQRGVFYTPRPVVSYIVRSVHELLQTEFGLTDGLARHRTWRICNSACLTYSCHHRQSISMALVKSVSLPPRRSCRCLTRLRAQARSWSRSSR